MNKKEKLIEIIQNAVGGCARNWADVIATALIESNEVIVPPCKVGDTVYNIANGVVEKCVITEWFYTTGMEHRYGFYAEVNNDSRIFIFDITSIGKTVFLTKEEAEQALKERI